MIDDHKMGGVEISCRGLLEGRGIEPTPHRMAVLEAIRDSHHPLRAQEILGLLSENKDINRVTIYRILDLLVEKGLVERISSGDRSFRYGLSPLAHGRPHAHFYCRNCGHMECLRPEEVTFDLEGLAAGLSGQIEKVEIRLDGTCEQCIKGGKKDKPAG